ncbi:MAG TPA: hypothetical protein VK654_06575 [Nitrospirota bacterium]|nr:hypothetical protein [Nitrospirota bacterium]
MNKIAVIDIDNTLWQFCDAFYRELKSINPIFPPVAKWTTWDFFLPYCTEEQFMAAVDTIHFLQDSDENQPYPESKNFLDTLRQDGYRIVIASHRREETRKPTERWLKKHHLAYDELHLSFDKTVLFESAAVVVDDAPHTLEKAVAGNAVGAGLLFPWNRSYAAGNGYGLFKDLNEVMAYIKGKR